VFDLSNSIEICFLTIHVATFSTSVS